ncbi:extracellular calcium-sensing receptor-like, partial [Clarias magur]
MEFTIHEINNRSDLLPGITLGYQIHDSCSTVARAIKVAFQHANGLEPDFNSTDSCSNLASAAVTAVIGDSASTQSISIARVLGLFGIPLVSHYSTCSCLSDKHQYPAFFRTIPSDQHQAAALARMVKHFGWTWIGAVRSDTDYGNYGMASFLKAAQGEGICVEYSESFYRTQPRSKLERVANVIRTSTARVIIAFMASGDIRLLLEELSRQPLPPLQWIGSETWITDSDFLRYNMCAGAIGFAVPRSVIPGLREFLIDLTPAKALESPLLMEFWEKSFNCYLKKRINNTEAKRECDGSEDIHTLQNPYTDTSQLRITNMVYKATMDFRELRFARALEFAIHEINNRTDILPGIKLGYQIYDSCFTVPMAVKIALQFASGLEPVFEYTNSCSESSEAAATAVIGDSTSTQSSSIARVLSLFGIPEVSHYATCPCLSDKTQYPTFLRTMPNDLHQANAVVKMVKHFGWTWIGAVFTDTDYGHSRMASFVKAAQAQGICVAYTEAFFRTQPRSKLERVVNVIRSSTARVVVAFIASADIRLILEELSQQPSTLLQWIGVETWIADPDFLQYKICAGAIGFAVPRSVIPGLHDFLLDLTLSRAKESPLLTEFWEKSFNCNLQRRTDDTEGTRECNGNEDIHTLKNPYTDTSQLRITSNVYKATYALAHAIHKLICNDKKCKKNIKVSPWQVLEQLKKLNFTTRNGLHVSFDSNGDPPALLELVNWQFNKDGHLDFMTVGQYDSLRPRGQEFTLSGNISWAGGQMKVPVSLCSESCPPGTRKAIQKQRPVCCFNCIPCSEGEISNETDSLDCLHCPPEFWPNNKQDSCLPKPVEFLSWNETLGIILALFSIAGAFMAVC